MEPEWMKKISSQTVCNFFYTWFVVYGVFAVLALFLTLGSLYSMKKLGLAGVLMASQSFLTLLIATAFMMFYYIICDRSLLTNASSSLASEGFANLQATRK